MTKAIHDVRVQFPAWPGESVTSIADMVAKTSGTHAVRKLLRTGIRRGVLLYGSLPCRVQQFCDATSSAYGDEHDLLANHTLHRFATSGMEAAMAERTAEHIVFGTVTRTKYPKLMPGFECGNRFGLQCPECALEATRVAGRRISYVAHCIPYATRCPWHGCKLVCDSECSSLEILLSQNRGQAREANALRYARLARSIHQNTVPGALWSRIRANLQDKGYATEEGRLRLKELRPRFLGLFSEGFEDARLTQLAADWHIIESCIRAANRVDRAAPASILVLFDWAAHEIEPIRRKPSRANLGYQKSMEERLFRDVHRKRWLDHSSAAPTATRTHLRHSALGLWTWLYRNDRPWLLANQRPARRPNNPRRTHEIPESVLSTIRGNSVDMRERTGGREPLPSAYQMRLSYGMNDYLFDRVTRTLRRIPNPAQRPAAREVFVSRRFRRAADRNVVEGLPRDIASVSRQARLRVETVQKFNRHR
ncbi:TnsD family Tn7-like transposition protein [Caballeronia sp. LZ032]|uniref:TnsD family Tn7-like transposition protein n=1 Tax=Caballeronia sp. LZ032 TaxID=3038565 RepID=UPI002860D7DD|nr:TnsD family Tn7-like transposition protein [Caballeronia sp. LZ032]MDR5879418.1 TnsD family Tn7-like transposition protein [Caballeronia sp. LZ032]